MGPRELKWDHSSVAEWALGEHTEVNERIIITGVAKPPEAGAWGETFASVHVPGSWEMVGRTISFDERQKLANIELCCARKPCPDAMKVSAGTIRLAVLRFFTIRYSRAAEKSEIQVRRVGPFDAFEPRCHCRSPLNPNSNASSTAQLRRRQRKSSSLSEADWSERIATFAKPSRRRQESVRRNRRGLAGVAEEELESHATELARRMSDLRKEKEALERERAKCETEGASLQERHDAAMSPVDTIKRTQEEKLALAREREEFEEEKLEWLEQHAKSSCDSDTDSTLSLPRWSRSVGEISMEIPFNQLSVDTSLNGMLGSGGWGKVQRGWWLGTPVAVKLIDVIRLKSGTVLDSAFQREMQSLDRARHPNVVALLAWASRPEEAQMALVTEVCAESLQDALDERRCKSLAANLKVVWDVSRAMAFLHHIGIGHRDLKPGNVLLTTKLSDKIEFTGDIRDLSPLGKVCDFGVAKVLSASDGATHSVSGTEIYNAPEVALAREHGRSVQTLHVDQWSFAVVTLEALANDGGVQNRAAAISLIGKLSHVVEDAFADSLRPSSSSTLLKVTTALREASDEIPKKRMKFTKIAQAIADGLAEVMSRGENGPNSR